MRQTRQAGDDFGPTLETLIGKRLREQLTDRSTTSAPLVIGRTIYSRHDLSTKLHIGNWKAARLLSIAVRSIAPKNIRDLYDTTSPYTFAALVDMRLGETAMYVLWRAFEAEGLSPEQWATSGNGDGPVAYRRIRHKELAAEARATKAGAAAARKRKAG